MQKDRNQKKIAHWIRIKRIVEDNPDLPYNAISSILLGLEDAKLGNVKEYDLKEKQKR